MEMLAKRLWQNSPLGPRYQVLNPEPVSQIQIFADAQKLDGLLNVPFTTVDSIPGNSGNCIRECITELWRSIATALSKPLLAVSELPAKNIKSGLTKTLVWRKIGLTNTLNTSVS